MYVYTYVYIFMLNVYVYVYVECVCVSLPMLICSLVEGVSCMKKLVYIPCLFYVKGYLQLKHHNTAITAIIYTVPFYGSSDRNHSCKLHEPLSIEAI